MACCPSHEREAGYATPAALVMALSLSLVAVAMVGRSVMMLRQARSDLQRAGAEYILDGAHLSAAATVVRAGEGGPYRWALSTDAGFAEATAESEVDKVSPAAAGAWSEAAFTDLGVADATALKTRLATVGDQPFADIGALDSAPLWRECAASLISSLGQRNDARPAAPAEPRPQPETPDWRVGQVWRVRITLASGWRDDRLVRFTGDARRPVAVVRRRLSRTDGGQGRCDVVLHAAA